MSTLSLILAPIVLMINQYYSNRITFKDALRVSATITPVSILWVFLFPPLLLSQGLVYLLVAIGYIFYATKANLTP